jgi:signal transduction histidine kinase
MLDRLTETARSLQAASSTDVQKLVDDYSKATMALVPATKAFVSHHDKLAGALDSLRTDSPRVVQQLRRQGQVVDSQNTFVLITSALDFARVNSTIHEDSLLEKIASLESNNDPRLQQLLTSVRVIIEERKASDDAWRQISESTFAGAAETLWLSQQSNYQGQHRAVDRYRLMLSVYSGLLLLGLGFLGIRLFQSYRHLNHANSELAVLNDSLEERVDERTRELRRAMADLQESQVQLVQAAKMSSLGQLVAGISHEINTPLLYLRSNASLVHERLENISQFVAELDDALDKARGPNRDKNAFLAGIKKIDKKLRNEGIGEDIVDSADLIRDSIEGLEQLSEMAVSLKDFSRLDRAPTASYNVNDGLEKTLLIAKNGLKSKVTVHKHYGEIPEISCSPSHINQVFLNLITNAAQAIKEKGDIVITTTADEEHVTITIADNGCGIPKHLMEKIRDPFFTTKEVGQGTGLGLSIVDRIIGSHNGELRIESEEGSGAVFTVVLPIRAQATQDSPESGHDEDLEPVDTSPERMAAAG